MHIHIPDGILPIWLWLTGFFVTAVLLVIMLPRLKRDVKKVPFVGMMTAVAFLIMSIPLGLPIHLNLMVLIGILVGAHWSLVIAFVVNFILASFGHGGLTIVGLNTIVLWLQAICGIFLFRFFGRLIKNYFVSASVSTFISLAISFLLMIGIVVVSTVEPAEFLHRHGEVGHIEISILTFLLLSLPIFLFGAVVESMVTGFVVQFIKKVKPELIKYEP